MNIYSSALLRLPHYRVHPYATCMSSFDDSVVGPHHHRSSSASVGLRPLKTLQMLAKCKHNFGCTEPISSATNYFILPPLPCPSRMRTSIRLMLKRVLWQARISHGKGKKGIPSHMFPFRAIGRSWPIRHLSGFIKRHNESSDLISSTGHVEQQVVEWMALERRSASFIQEDFVCLIFLLIYSLIDVSFLEFRSVPPLPIQSFD